MSVSEKHHAIAEKCCNDFRMIDDGCEGDLMEIITRALSTAHREGFEEGMKRAARELIDAWEELPDGDHDIDTANAWFANSLFPVLERFKTILSEAGEGA